MSDRALPHQLCVANPPRVRQMEATAFQHIDHYTILATHFKQLPPSQQRFLRSYISHHRLDDLLPHGCTVEQITTSTTVVPHIPPHVLKQRAREDSCQDYGRLCF